MTESSLTPQRGSGPVRGKAQRVRAGTSSFEARHVCLGRFDRPYSVRGWIKFSPFCENPLDITAEYDSVVVEAPQGSDSDEQQIFLDDVRPHGKYWIARVRGCSNRSEVERFSGRTFGILAEHLPPAEEDAWYVRDLVGMAAVREANSEPLGTVVAVHNYGAGDIVELKSSSGEHVADVPFTRDFVVDVDVEARQIVIADVPGLISE